MDASTNVSAPLMATTLNVFVLMASLGKIVIFQVCLWIIHVQFEEKGECGMRQ